MKNRLKQWWYRCLDFLCLRPPACAADDCFEPIVPRTVWCREHVADIWKEHHKREREMMSELQAAFDEQRRTMFPDEPCK